MDPLIKNLRAIVGRENVLSEPEELLVYECDGYTIEKNVPDVVVFPTTTEQVVEIVRACNNHGVPFLPRGAGTSLAGGCLPVGGGVMKSVSLDDLRKVIAQGCRFVPFEKTELALASLGDDANLIGAAQVWHHRFGQRNQEVA